MKQSQQGGGSLAQLVMCVGSIMVFFMLYGMVCLLCAVCVCGCWWGGGRCKWH